MHVSDQLFSFFKAVEIELRFHLQASEADGIKEKAVKKILDSEEVNFHWSEIAINWEEEEAGVLLEMVVSHWVTVRGFSYASAFLEKYKQKQENCTKI